MGRPPVFLPPVCRGATRPPSAVPSSPCCVPRPAPRSRPSVIEAPINDHRARGKPAGDSVAGIWTAAAALHWPGLEYSAPHLFLLRGPARLVRSWPVAKAGISRPAAQTRAAAGTLAGSAPAAPRHRSAGKTRRSPSLECVPRQGSCLSFTATAKARRQSEAACVPALFTAQGSSSYTP